MVVSSLKFDIHWGQGMSSETTFIATGLLLLYAFGVQGSVHRKCIPFDIFPTSCNFTQFIYFWKTALHVLGGIFTHHQEHI